MNLKNKGIVILVMNPTGNKQDGLAFCINTFISQFQQWQHLLPPTPPSLFPSTEIFFFIIIDLWANMKRTLPLDNTEIIILKQAVLLERFYLTCGTVKNNYM